MNIQDVKKTVRAAIRNGSLRLEPTALQSSSVAALFDAYFPKMALEMDVEKVDEDDASITVVGLGHNQPINGLATTARFTAPGDVAQCLISTTAGPSWRLSTAFPGLEASVFSSTSFAAGATMTLDSTGVETGERTSGLRFAGELNLASFVSDVAWLFGGVATLKMAGPIHMKSGEPEADISAPLSGAIQIGYLKLPAFQLRLVSNYLDETPTSPAYLEAYSELATKVAFTTKGTSHDIPLSARYFNQGGLIALVADLSDGVLAGLVDIAEQLAEKADLGSVVPKDFELPGDLNLTALTVRVDLLQRSLVSVTLGIETEKSWSIVSDPKFGKLLTIDRVGMTFVYQAANKSVDLSLYGDFGVGPNGVVEVWGDVALLQFGGYLKQGTSVNLIEVVEHFAGSTPHAPELDVTDFEFSVDAPKKSFSVQAAVFSTWTLSLGEIDIQIVELAFSISRDPQATTASISGAAQVGPVFLALNWDVPGDFQLSSSVPEIPLHDLIKAFSTEPMWGGPFPNPTLKDSLVYIERREDGAIYAAVGTSFASSPEHKAFGAVEFDFQESNGKTGYIVGFKLAEEFNLGDLSSEFSAFSFIKLEEAGLVLSSVDDPNFQFRSFSEPDFNFPKRLPSAPPGVKRGLALFAKLKLEGGVLEPVGKLLKGVGALLLAVQVPTDLKQTRFEAALDGHYKLIGDAVVLDEVALFFSPSQEAFGLQTTMTFSLQKNTSLALTGIIEISGASVDLELRTATPWKEPFGIKGLTVNGMGVGIGIGDDIALTLAGSVTIGTGDKSRLDLEVAMEFSAEEEGLPKALLAKEREVGKIDLAEIVYTFAPEIHVPAELLDITLSDFQLIVVADPLGWIDPLDNRRYGAGLNVGGKLEFYGLDAKFGIQVDYSVGLSAMGEIEPAVRIADVFVLTNATDPAKGPYVEINTFKSPYLKISAALTLFEIESYLVDILVSNTQLVFHVAYAVALIGHLEIDASLDGKKGFSAGSEARFALKNVGPIKAGSFSLGTLNVDLNLDARFDVAVSTEAFTLKTKASFEFQGVGMSLPEISVNERFKKLEELAEIYAKRLAAELWDVGKSVLRDAEKLFAAARAGAIKLGDDIGHILRELGVGIADAARLMKSAANALAWDAKKVGALLKAGFNADAKAVAAAMRAAQYDVEEAASAIASAFGLGAEDAARFLQEAGYDLGEIARALRKLWNYDAKQVAKFFKSAFHAGDKAVNAALGAAGYAKDAIEDAMKSVFNWAKHAIDKAKRKLNPKHW